MPIGQPIQKENAGSARHLQWQVITGDTTKLQTDAEPAPCSHAAFGYFVSYCSYVTAVLFIERLQI
jgi:hypothetical protein